MHENSRIAASEIISPHTPHIKISSTHQRACICTFKTFSPFWPLLTYVGFIYTRWLIISIKVGWLFCWTVGRIRFLLLHIFNQFLIPFGKEKCKKYDQAAIGTHNQSIHSQYPLEIEVFPLMQILFSIPKSIYCKSPLQCFLLTFSAPFELLFTADIQC